MFGFKSASTSFTERERALLDEAGALLGIGPPRWRWKHAEFRHLSEPRPVSVDVLRRLLRSDPSGDEVVCAIGLAAAVGVQPPPEMLTDVSRIAHLLRPRLLHPRELQGPRRLMCRREAFGGLIRAIALGPRDDAPLITTAVLDRWRAEFDDIFARAVSNLANRMTNRHILEVQGAPGLLALLHEREQASSGVFILDRLFPPDLLPHGVVFATPGPEVLLAFPVIEGAGPDGLAAIVQASFSMAHEREEPLSERVFWHRDQRTIELPMTAVQDRKSRRIHIEARGPIEDLLRILGAIE